MEKAKKGTVLRKKRQLGDETEDENILQDCLNILEFLFRFRLVEKIARPIDKKVREDKLTEYGERLADLHEKLAKIKNEIVEMTYNEGNNQKSKSVFGEITSKPTDWRKIIRNIEAKYNEVSFLRCRYDGIHIGIFVRKQVQMGQNTGSSILKQVLIDGSFKYCRKICLALGLHQEVKMETISIEEWAAQCLDTKPSDACC